MTHVTLDEIEPWQKVWSRPSGTYFAYFTRELEMRIVAHFTGCAQKNIGVLVRYNMRPPVLF